MSAAMPPGRALIIPMLSRDTREEHRSATPLELFFDLCFVVAVAVAANELHHGMLEHPGADPVLAFSFSFFGVWWAWLNFTWFASAFDTDDAAYRFVTLVQMAGVRPTAFRYATGVGACQVLWIAAYFVVPAGDFRPVFVVRRSSRCWCQSGPHESG